MGFGGRRDAHAASSSPASRPYSPAEITVICIFCVKSSDPHETRSVSQSRRHRCEPARCQRQHRRRDRRRRSGHRCREPLQQRARQIRLRRWWRRKPRPHRLPTACRWKLLDPPCAPAAQRPFGHANRLAHCGHGRHVRARREDHDLQVHPTAQKSQRRRQCPPSAPGPPAAKAEAPAECLSGLCDPAASRLSIVVRPVQRARAIWAAGLRHLCRDPLVDLNQFLEEFPPQTQLVQHSLTSDPEQPEPSPEVDPEIRTSS
jgi:hypothetical protein